MAIVMRFLQWILREEYALGDFFEIGKIVNTQGIKGEVRILPTTDDPSRFDLLSEITAVKNGVKSIFKITNVRYQKQFVILKLDGIDSINDAEKLKEHVIIIPKDQALPLNKDEYYLSDLLGVEVFTEEGEALGAVVDVLFTGANDVYIVRPKEGKDLLVPAIKNCILDVDIAAKRMTVKLLEGLREL